MLNEKEIRDDTLTLLLANAINRHLKPSEHAQKIRRCAKVICGRTKDKPLKNACRSIRNEKSDSLVIKAIDNAEYKYLMTY
jgi:hypothetical protein